MVQNKEDESEKAPRLTKAKHSIRASPKIWDKAGVKKMGVIVNSAVPSSKWFTL